MRRAFWGRIGFAVVTALFVMPAAAHATVLGALDPLSTDPGLAGDCNGTNENYVQAGIAPGDPSYAVPTGGGTITSWSTKFGSSGAAVGLEVWRPQPLFDEYELVALDSETLAPNAQGISTYAVAIPVQAGDIIGMSQPVPSTVHCSFQPHPGNINRFFLRASASPAVGTVLSFSETLQGDQLNLTATVQQTADLSLTQSVTPKSARPGALVQFLFTASNAGPAPSPASFSDKLPSGLKAISAVAQGGSCSLGSTVNCLLSGVPAGSSSTIVINAQAIRPGNYTNTASISADSTNIDPNLVNNTASATGTVLPQCIVPKLTGHTESKANKLLSGAHCALGNVTKPKHHQGKLLVVSQSPVAGSVETAGTPVAIKLGQKKKK